MSCFSVAATATIVFGEIEIGGGPEGRGAANILIVIMSHAAGDGQAVEQLHLRLAIDALDIRVSRGDAAIALSAHGVLLDIAAEQECEVFRRFQRALIFELSAAALRREIDRPVQIAVPIDDRARNTHQTIEQPIESRDIGPAGSHDFGGLRGFIAVDDGVGTGKGEGIELGVRLGVADGAADRHRPRNVQPALGIERDIVVAVPFGVAVGGVGAGDALGVDIADAAADVVTVARAADGRVAAHRAEGPAFRHAGYIQGRLGARRDDIDHAADRIRAVERALRPAQDFGAHDIV